MVRYLDSGSRNAGDSLSTWIATESTDVVDLRIQSGFFSAGAISDAITALAGARLASGAVHLVLGSNDGMTSRVALEGLLLESDPDRAERRVAIVRYADGYYFHPKTYHFRRADGSATAYVGSANFTERGVRRHVEAGIVLDSRLGDDIAVLDSIAAATDAWFSGGRDGVHILNAATDFDDLVARRIIGVVRPRPARTAISPVPLPVLAPLVPSASSPVAVQMSWTKTLSDGDARRKPGGIRSHDRGAITLTKSTGGYTAGVGLHAIDHTWFRNRLFDGAPWTAQSTSTRLPKETAVVPMRVIIRGTNLGIVDLDISDAPNRRQDARGVPTTHLHTSPLAGAFAANDLRGATATVTRYADGTYSLVIL